MSESRHIEERLAQVETELAELKGDVTSLKRLGNWIDVISGTFKDDPEFDEILRLGKKNRDAHKRADK
jgi:hypothetical protein